VFLPKSFGYPNAADRFLNLGVNRGAHPPGIGRDLAGDFAKAEGNAGCNRTHAHQQQGQPHIDRQQPGRQNGDQQHLAEQIHDQIDGFGEILRIGRDAADNFAGGVFVVKRQIVAHGGVEHVFAQFQHHIANHAGRKPLADVVEHPAGRADRQNGRRHHDDHAQRRVGADHVDGFGNQNRPGRAGGRIQRNHHGHQRHQAGMGPKIPRNPTDQFPVAILAIIGLGFEAV
jgi:hypothetical protein